MNYHDIKKDDMLNGDGIRVTLFVSGCDHDCFNCQNPQTHDPSSGIRFDKAACGEIYQELSKDYISGLTLSGGDPLFSENLCEIRSLVENIREKYPLKTIWMYTGYVYEQIEKNQYIKDILKNIDVLVDGRFVQELFDINAPFVGSTNQRVIDVQNTLKKNEIVLWR